MKEEKLKFNKWSRERIAQGRKFCTTRTRTYNDPRVIIIIPIRLRAVKNLFWQMEGADSPEEFEKVWRGIFRGKFDPDRGVFVHIGDFRE